MYYLIESTLKECSPEEITGGKSQYVAVLSPEEWTRDREKFEMGIDIEFDEFDLYTTKAEVNYDSVTGAFSLPDRKNIAGKYREFAFALDEKDADLERMNDIRGNLRDIRTHYSSSRRRNGCNA